jgi:integrin beta 1
MDETNVCDDVRVGDEVTFEVTLEHFKCVKGGKNSFQIHVGPSGLTEKLTIDVTVDCECPCETEQSVRENKVLRSKNEFVANNTQCC